MCTTSVLTFGESQRSGKIQVFLRQNTFFFRILPFGAGRSQEKRRKRKERMGKISMKYVVNWIPLRIRVRSRYTQPHLKGGPEPLEKESHEFLGSKRDDRFSNLFLEMVPKTRQGSFFVPALA